MDSSSSKPSTDSSNPKKRPNPGTKSQNSREVQYEDSASAQKRQKTSKEKKPHLSQAALYNAIKNKSIESDSNIIPDYRSISYPKHHTTASKSPQISAASTPSPYFGRSQVEKLIELELKEDVREVDDRRKKWSKERLVREGMSLFEVVCESSGVSSSGEFLIKISLPCHDEPLPYHQFSAGDVAILKQSQSSFNNNNNVRTNNNNNNNVNSINCSSSNNNIINDSNNNNNVNNNGINSHQLMEVQMMRGGESRVEQIEATVLDVDKFSILLMSDMIPKVIFIKKHSFSHHNSNSTPFSNKSHMALFRLDFGTNRTAYDRMLKSLKLFVKSSSTSSTSIYTPGLNNNSSSSNVLPIQFQYGSIPTKFQPSGGHPYSTMRSVLLDESGKAAELASSPSILFPLHQPQYFPADFNNWKLNESQKDTIKQCLKRSVSLIQGPPGTGKTHTVVHLIRLLCHLYRGLNIPILACAYTNVATDNLLEGCLDQKINALRLGRPVKVRPDLREATLEHKLLSHPLTEQINYKKQELESRTLGSAAHRNLKQEIASLEKSLFFQTIHSASVICSTCVFAGDPMIQGIYFPIVIIDECTQATEPATLIPIVNGAAQQLILVGDHHQLPPTVKSRNPSPYPSINLNNMMSKSSNGKNSRQTANSNERIHQKAGGTDPAPAAPAPAPAAGSVNPSAGNSSTGSSSSFSSYAGVSPSSPSSSPPQEDQGLSLSLFSRLVRDSKIQVLLLDTQYRMHPMISHFPSKHFYDSQIKNGINAVDRPLIPGFSWPKLSDDQYEMMKSMVEQSRGIESSIKREEFDESLHGRNLPLSTFTQSMIGSSSSSSINLNKITTTTTTNPSNNNNNSSFSSFHLIPPFLPISFMNMPNSGEVKGRKMDSHSWTNPVEATHLCDTVVNILRTQLVPPHSIGIVTPYAAQVRLIYDLLSSFLKEFTFQGKQLSLLDDEEMAGYMGFSVAGITISSVDGFQGREKDLIIISAVRSNQKGKLGFLKDWRRLNVALTRAKRGIIVFGDRNLLSNDLHWKSWIDWIESMGGVKTFAPPPSKSNDNHNNNNSITKEPKSIIDEGEGKGMTLDTKGSEGVIQEEA